MKVSRDSNWNVECQKPEMQKGYNKILSCRTRRWSWAMKDVKAMDASKLQKIDKRIANPKSNEGYTNHE